MIGDRSSRMVAAFIFSVQCLWKSAWADPELKQLHVITRHGSRLPLPKHAMTLEETSESSTLTPLGQKQHFELGEWLREHYLETSFLEVLEKYSPSQVQLESSAYERTIVSANSLALGLFPVQTRGLQLIPETPANIPVYSNARTNDIAIRPYDNCPVFLDSLERLYTTPSWSEMEADSMLLLRRLADVPAFAEYIEEKDGAYVPLKNLWNVFDAINVAKTECTTTTNDMCSQLPDPTLATSINDEDWASIQELSHAVERIRYGPEYARNYLGGLLLNTIVKRTQTEDSDSQEVPSRFFLTSAHYPTLLGIFAALNVPFDTHYEPGQEAVIPEYASALIFEVYQDRDNNYAQSIRILYKSGTSTEATYVRFSDQCPTDTTDGCSMKTFLQLLDGILLTPQDWCTLCQNTEADVCMQNNAAQSCPNQRSNNLLAALFFGGMMTLAMILLFATTFCSLGRRGYVGDTSSTAENRTPGVDAVKPPERAPSTENNDPNSAESREPPRCEEGDASPAEEYTYA